ncbi:MAG: endonuclease/exonuclease/phosphatase family protein [Lentimicrobium sp.]
MIAVKKGRRKFPLIKSLFFTANLIVVVLFAMGYVAAFIPPDRNWIFAFAGLAFPYLALANIAFAIFWLITGKKYIALLSITVLIISWSRLGGYYRFHTGHGQPADSTGLIVMSYNVRLFDLYNWNKNKISENASGLFQLLAEHKPDLLCIQEYHAGRSGKVDICDSIIKYTGLKHKYIAYVSMEGKDKPYGIATFSRWPLTGTGIVSFDDNPINFCLYSDILIGKDTVRLFNVHLESIKFSREDYLFVTDLRNNQEDQDVFAENSLKILQKLKRAFISRARQSRKLSEKINQSPYPVIVCGDFNDTPSSYTYHKITGKLNDAFRSKGRGFSQTYAGALPSFRIDYILHDKNRFTTNSFSRIREPLSDHYPVVANLSLVLKDK